MKRYPAWQCAIVDASLCEESRGYVSMSKCLVDVGHSGCCLVETETPQGDVKNSCVQLLTGYTSRCLTGHIRSCPQSQLGPARTINAGVSQFLFTSTSTSKIPWQETCWIRQRHTRCGKIRSEIPEKMVRLHWSCSRDFAFSRSEPIARNAHSCRVTTITETLVLKVPALNSGPTIVVSCSVSCGQLRPFCILQHFCAQSGQTASWCWCTQQIQGLCAHQTIHNP